MGESLVISPSELAGPRGGAIRIRRPIAMRLMCAMFVSVSSAVAYGQEAPSPGHAQHGTMMHETPDARVAVELPPPMQQHMLANMRNHLQAMTEILLAMSKAEYSKAADLADQRLGLESTGASACKENGGGTAAMGATSGMDPDRMMGAHMPIAMRKLGLAMHQSASDFATAARAAVGTGDAKPALAALSQVSQNCVACHSSYRIR